MHFDNGIPVLKAEYEYYRKEGQANEDIVPNDGRVY